MKILLTKQNDSNMNRVTSTTFSLVIAAVVAVVVALFHLILSVHYKCSLEDFQDFYAAQYNRILSKVFLKLIYVTLCNNLQ